VTVVTRVGIERAAPIPTIATAFERARLPPRTFFAGARSCQVEFITAMQNYSERHGRVLLMVEPLHFLDRRRGDRVQIRSSNTVAGTGFALAGRLPPD